MFARRTNWNLSTNRYSLALEQARRSGRTLLDLTASNPTTVGLRYEDERILRALQHPRALEYEPASKGIFPAREAVASYYAERGIEVSPERIILTVSTSEAYSYCFHPIKKGFSGIFPRVNPIVLHSTARGVTHGGIPELKELGIFRNTPQFLGPPSC